MKIALIAPTEIPSRRANTIQVMKMAQALAATGSEVRLAFPSQHSTPPSSEELASLYGLERLFPIQPLESSPRLRRYDYAWRAVSWARSWGAGLLYTRLPQAAALASLRGRPTILETHDLPQGQAGPLAFRAFLRGRGARRLVVITRALAGDLARLYGAPQDPPFTLVLPDGVDLARYAQVPPPEEARRRLPMIFSSQPPALPPGRFTAGYSGHLYAGRGIELILRLAASLPQVNFLLAGGEPQQVERIRQQAAGLPNLILTGFVPNADLPIYQAACDVLLMPYQPQVAASSGGDIARYLSPMKLFEYMACGRAILSSSLPVLCETLNAQNAILLPPDDPEAWRAALERLESDPGLRDRLARQARSDAAQYSWEARARSIIAGL